ncbi:DUF3817 domain-containing protein [Glutamicibacter sp.]|uniref:DUF3817 domain-containing protein n=1 Tax=Glutamicibacter sp. TaxID=1931995 RepID=UPI0028BDB74F|nr:DUF3817 domain-containing protein [Glutamicibacter sp.]
MTATGVATPTLQENLPPRGSVSWQQGIRQLFRIVSFVEVVTWIGMLTAMVFKYFINGNAMGVTIFGWAHGLTWLAYLVITTLTALTFRWRIWVWLTGCVGSGLPFITWPFEYWMMKSGRLDVK